MPLITLLFMLVLTGCEYGSSEFRFVGKTMGTTYSVVVNQQSLLDQPVKYQALQDQINTELIRINRLMSTYDTASQLSQFNAQSVGEMFAVHADLHLVLRTSQVLSELSGGAFDVTVGALVNLWGFGPEASLRGVPSPLAVKMARKNVGYQALEVNPGNYLIRKRKALYIDLSAIAKGFAVDQLSRLLRAQGYHDFLVEIGGELFASGRAPGNRPWQVGIELPSALGRAIYTSLPLQNMAMATSGDYRNYFKQGGKRYSHTIDPRTGYPIDHSLVSVTVLAKSAMLADAWATAISVLGADMGLQLANRQQLAVLVIIKTGSGLKTLRSDKLAAYTAT
ncbi:MAG TPA: FAD:protein FMN transferase [Pseudomonadales bacterium]|nr:FAD:protein FMN transferase [Pseudomonadales bacterium]